MARWLLPIVLLLAAPAPASGASLPGTEWNVTRVGSSKPGSELKLTLEFPKRREFTGFDGCNHFGGRYRARGTRLRFGDIRSTAIGCDFALPGLTDRLVRTRRYRVRGNRLELRRGGRTLVVLRRR